MKIKKLDMTKVLCPVHHIQMVREEDEVKCPKCGFASPVILVRHSKGHTELETP